MERIADETGVAPVRISFVAALRLIVDERSARAAAHRARLIAGADLECFVALAR